VKARAGGACEYFRLVEVATGITFHLEHIQPRSRGGQTSLRNLAFSCPGCNLAKSEAIVAIDRRGQLQPLFNPRSFEPSSLGWHLHFILDLSSGLIVPRSEIGEATIDALKVNEASRIFARTIQICVGLIA